MAAPLQPSPAAPPTHGMLFPKLSRLLSFIRFSHTIFALPFALGAMVVAANGAPPLRIFVLIVVAMVFARTAAMVFNRLADWEIDQRNPRTAGRHKLVSRKTAIAVLAASSLAFIATTLLINPACFAFSPLALVILFFYSLTKRFTAFSHFFLGLALGISCLGAWLAVRGHFDFPPFVLAVAVMLWVAGFDLIYATQDLEFDRSTGLHSLVVRLGVPRTLVAAQWLHAAMWLLLCAFGWTARLGMPFYAGLVVIVGALFYEHATARKLDLAAVNQAFFQSNAFVGVVFLAAIIADRAWQ